MFYCVAPKVSLEDFLSPIVFIFRCPYSVALQKAF